MLFIHIHTASYGPAMWGYKFYDCRFIMYSYVKVLISL